MSGSLNVCLYNTESKASREIVEAISSLNFVRFNGEVGTPEALAAMLQEPLIDLVFFHLDTDPEVVVEVIGQVATRHPDLAMIALSHENGPTAILAPMRAGCDQFVCEPIDAMDLAAAVGRVAARRLSTRTQSRLFCVAGASGGAGATSIASNLALEIGSLTDAKCALVDLNVQFGDVAAGFDCAPKYTLADVASMGHGIERSLLATTLTELSCNVSVLARPDRIEDSVNITADDIQRIVQLLGTLFETVVVDLPRQIDPCAVVAAEHADMLLIVCQLLVPSIRNAKRMMDAYVLAGVPEDRIHVVVNRCESRKQRVKIDDVAEYINMPVFATVPNDYQLMARSLDFGRPVAAVDKDNPIRLAIRKIARRLTTDPGAEPEIEPRSKGLFRRLMLK